MKIALGYIRFLFLVIFNVGIIGATTACILSIKNYMGWEAVYAGVGALFLITSSVGIICLTGWFMNEATEGL